MERDIHPVETSLFIAAALRGWRLEDTADGRLYRVMQGRGEGAQILADNATAKDVANLCGAEGSVTLRQAAERDGLIWPSSPESFLRVLRNL